MKSTFYLVLNMRTPDGFKAYGRYELGTDRQFATGLFSELQGRGSVDEKDILHIDLIEENEGLPVNVNVISCTADEIAANCKLVTKELFRHINMNDKAL